MNLFRWSVSVAFAFLLAPSLLAAEPGRASGSITIDGQATALAFAYSHPEEDLYDSSKQDTDVVLLDRDAEAAVILSDWELAQAAKSGGVSLVLRFDGTKILNARLNAPGLDGTSVLPGQWFTYRPAAAAAGQTAGAATLAAHEANGHAVAGTFEFHATPVAPPPEPVEEEPAVEPEQEAPPAALPPATTSTIDADSLTPLMVKAMMEKDEAQVLKLLKLGANPNARDSYGIPMLNWAVMTCLPQAVQALVDAKADLTYERAPGMTILMEAGACPEAEKILRAAGAK